MARLATKETVSQRADFSFITLARWRLRPTWFLLLMTGVGIIAAVTIAGTIPLLSSVMVTAAGHDVLKATAATSIIALDTSTAGISTRVVRGVQQQLDPYVQRSIGPYLSQSVPLAIQSTGYTVTTPRLSGDAYELRLYSTSIAQAATHLKLVQGRLPRDGAGGGEIETLLSPSVAQSLHVTVGSPLTLQFQYATSQEGIYAKDVPTATLHLRIVGLFEVSAANIFYWHGNDFQTVKENQFSSYTLLLPNTALLAALDQLATGSHSRAIFLTHSFELTWLYQLNVSHIAYSQLADLTNQLNNLQANFVNTFANPQTQGQPISNPPFPYLAQASIYNPVAGSFDLPNTLEKYINRVDVFRIPETMLVLLIIGLIFLFVGLMADLLVGYQAAAIALLRSRGASIGQVTAALIAQVTVLGVIALLIGIPLAILLVMLIAQHIISPANQDALNLITDAPLQTVLDVGWYAIVTVLLAILVVSLLLRGVVSMNVLTLRSETS
ncbi:MAG TPA: FtsX-like permease family protein, partial [Ktedonobacteraceae bacterium]|nr:FtsX-like permease family protein [Ktedonobacteraceae bacterium]